MKTKFVYNGINYTLSIRKDKNAKSNYNCFAHFFREKEKHPIIVFSCKEDDDKNELIKSFKQSYESQKESLNSLLASFTNNK